MLTLTTFDKAAQEEMMTGPSIIPRTTPGSRGEHDLQERHGTRARAEAIYHSQMFEYLDPQMRTFIARQETRSGPPLGPH
jgi:hypothetical protein